MCLDCYPDRCFTYACKNASHRAAVSVPGWCCTERRDSSSKCAFCPVFAATLCSSLEAQQWFPYSSNALFISFLTLCYTSCSPASRRRITIMALLHPIPHLSPPFLHLTVPVMTTHLFYPDPALMPFLYFLSSSSLSVPHSVHSPLPPLQLLYSHSISGEMSAVLYFAVTLKTAFIRFILRWCEKGMVSLYCTHRYVLYDMEITCSHIYSIC